jgi:hypothetical protein
MLIETLVTLLAAAAPATPPALALAPASLLRRTPAPAYAPEKRAVDNWRVESALWLDMGPLDAVKRALDAEANEPARCVKLNNYWCVKRAGWNGEIAADADGHVAFASAEEGAAVAALLLRRYYVDYKRHSARAIIERWAPAQCSLMPVRPTPGPPASREGMARMLPQRVAPMGLAPRGLQNTLRARWLAAHGRGGVGASSSAKSAFSSPRDLMPAPAASPGMPTSRGGMARMLPQRVVPMGPAPRGLQSTLRARWLAAHGRGGGGASPSAKSHFVGPPDLMPAPSIMEGVSEARRQRPKARLEPPAPAPALDAAASLASLPAPPPLPPLGGTFDCSGELARIANYAAHVAEGIAATPNDDLQLFDGAGQPTDNLARALVNMAAVEIGPARPRMGLVTAAVAQLRRLLKDPTSDATASAAPGAGPMTNENLSSHQPQ